MALDIDIENLEVRDFGKENPHVKVLWTGGFDSTYRMIQLSKKEVTIQPFYLSDKFRRSEHYELEAIKSITDDIEKHPETKCTILPLIKFSVSDLKEDGDIVEAFQRLRKISYIGPQYIWLSEFAKTNKGLELSIEKDVHDIRYGATYCLLHNGNIKQVREGDIDYWILDKEKSSKDLNKIFGEFHFPVINITKIGMVEEYKRLGFTETMNKTWFCHTPVKNEPCGVCNPCKQTIEDGLSFRIPTSGMKRYATEMRLGNKKWFKYIKKIRLRINGY
jgi:7-cyano-7-deazaguanine synthase